MSDRVRLTPRSLTVRLGVFFGVLLALPFVLYVGFQAADRQKNGLVLNAVAQEGMIIIQGMRTGLAQFSADSQIDFEAQLAAYAAPDRNLKLFYRPSGDVSGFFYMAAAPRLAPEAAALESQTLEAAGLFARLADSCAGGASLAQRFTNPQGREELLTSITPLDLPNGCWVLLVSHASDAYLGTSLGRPLWMTAAAQIAVASYFLIALLAAWLFWDVRRDLRSIAQAARSMRANARQRGSFAEQIRMPELSEVTAELDRLMGALDASQALIRRAAEENAHALKTPIAVIEQALEPLRRIRRQVSADAARSIDVIGKAIERLDGLVTAARTLDTVTADSLGVAHEKLALSGFLRQMVASFEAVAAARSVSLVSAINDGLAVKAADDLMETVMENLLENALSFSPAGGAIHITARGDGDAVMVAVADDGPGVAEAELERIFERYYSARVAGNDRDGLHFGLGLWIVKRNLEAVGGTVAARNRAAGGLEVTMRLPRAA